MESEYISICTVLGLSCCKRLKKYWQLDDESRKSKDGSVKKRDVRLAEDEFIENSLEAQSYR